MGLFDAFKKKDKKKQDDLDLPPPPPSLGQQGDEMPNFPDFDQKMPSSSKQNQNDEFDFSKDQEIEDMKMPEFPQIPEIEDSMESIHAPDEHIDGMDFDMQEFEDDKSVESMPPPPKQIPIQQQRQQVPVQKPYVSKQPTSKPVVSSGSTYLKVDDFRLMLGTMSSARSEIRKSEESIAKLENIKASKDKSFDKMKSSMEDIQKKLIFIDKTLFKGE